MALIWESVLCLSGKLCRCDAADSQDERFLRHADAHADVYLLLHVACAETAMAGFLSLSLSLSERECVIGETQLADSLVWRSARLCCSLIFREESSVPARTMKV